MQEDKSCGSLMFGTVWLAHVQTVHLPSLGKELISNLNFFKKLKDHYLWFCADCVFIPAKLCPLKRFLITPRDLLFPFSLKVIWDIGSIKVNLYQNYEEVLPATCQAKLNHRIAVTIHCCWVACSLSFSALGEILVPEIPSGKKKESFLTWNSCVLGKGNRKTETCVLLQKEVLCQHGK